MGWKGRGWEWSGGEGLLNFRLIFQNGTEPGSPI